MDIAVLQKKVGDRLTFCGSVCVQTMLAWGTVEDVKRMFPGRNGVSCEMTGGCRVLVIKL